MRRIADTNAPARCTRGCRNPRRMFVRIPLRGPLDPRENSGPSAEGRAAGGGAVSPLDVRVARRRQPDGAGRGRDGLGQLLFDAGREAGDRPRVQLAGGRPGLPRTSDRRVELRLLGQSLRARSRRRWQEDPGERLPDDDRRRIGGRLRRPRSRAGAADPCANPDEGHHDAGLRLAAHGRPPREMGAGVRPPQAWVHRRRRRRSRVCSLRSACTR